VNNHLKVNQHIVILVLLKLFSLSVTNGIGNESTIFQLEGNFFTPSLENKIRTWDIPVPDNKVFKKIGIELDVTIGNWWNNNPDGVHNLFWFTRQGIWRSNTVGYVNLFGPNRNLIKQMTNLDLAKGEAQAETTKLIVQEGHTYHIIYTYDCVRGVIITELSEDGIQKAFIRMPTTTSEIQTKGGFYQLWIGLDEKYNECPTIGWTYSNLKISMETGSSITSKPAPGPLKVHSVNPRYFDDGTGRAVLLVGVNHGWELQDNAWSTRYTLDWRVFLDYLKKYNLNYIRLWRAESTTGGDNSSFLTEPIPYLRTGPGNAMDGLSKFDLARFNQEYFDRIRKRCIEAGKEGIYVNIMFFEKHSTYNQRISGGAEYPWKGHPFHPQNNINGINPDINGDGCPREIHHLPQTGYTDQQSKMAKEVLSLQEAYIKKVIDTVNDLDNVLFEICNEALPDDKTDTWQRYLINFVKAYEIYKSKQHVVGFTGPAKENREDPWPDLDDQLSSRADFVSPRNANEYRTSPPKNEGSKVIFADSDHINPYGRDYIWIWKSFIRGLHPQALEAYDIIEPDSAKIDSIRDELVRLNLGYCLNYSNRMNLVSMAPHNELATTTYCLANPGSEYLVFAPEGGGFAVDLTTASNSLYIEWLNIKTGEISVGDSISSNASGSFIPPFPEPAVLYIKKK
jgi:hypothetical protein